MRIMILRKGQEVVTPAQVGELVSEAYLAGHRDKRLGVQKRRGLVRFLESKVEHFTV